jgi:hypothetical protein
VLRPKALCKRALATAQPGRRPDTRIAEVGYDAESRDEVHTATASDVQYRSSRMSCGFQK